MNYLRARGLHLLQANFSCRGGEIDLIMLEDNPPQVLAYTENSKQLVFVEVRFRKATNQSIKHNKKQKHEYNEYANAIESVGTQKQRRIISAAQYFLQRHHKYADYFCRFDVCAIQGNKINWQQNAFCL